MNIFILTFHKHDKAFASDLYLIYNRSPAARVCKSDTDRLLMLYLVHISEGQGLGCFEPDVLLHFKVPVAET